jgi:hypothetical protein
MDESGWKKWMTVEGKYGWKERMKIMDEKMDEMDG